MSPGGADRGLVLDRLCTVTGVWILELARDPHGPFKLELHLMGELAGAKAWSEAKLEIKDWRERFIVVVVLISGRAGGSLPGTLLMCDGIWAGSARRCSRVFKLERVWRNGEIAQTADEGRGDVWPWWAFGNGIICKGRFRAIEVETWW